MKLSNSTAGVAMFLAALLLPAFCPSTAYSDVAGADRANTRVGVTRRPLVAIAADRMTAALHAVPVVKVLDILAQKTNLRIVFHGTLDTTLTAEFNNQSLEEGLRRVFRGRNLVYFYSSPAAVKSRRLVEVAIFDASDGIYGAEPEAENNASDNGMQVRGEHEAGIIAELAQLIEETEDSEERARAVRQLGKTWSEDAEAPLAKALARDESALVRQAAADALGRTWSEKAVQPLIDALVRDPDALVREQAARALAQTAGEEAVPALAHALAEDRRWFVREAAAVALGTIAGREALDALEAPSAVDRDAWVREAATLAVLDSR